MGNSNNKNNEQVINNLVYKNFLIINDNYRNTTFECDDSLVLLVKQNPSIGYSSFDVHMKNGDVHNNIRGTYFEKILRKVPKETTSETMITSTAPTAPTTPDTVKMDPPDYSKSL